MSIFALFSCLPILFICAEDIFAKLQNELRDLMSNKKDRVDHATPQLEVRQILLIQLYEYI
jgi:hypothetical protein